VKYAKASMREKFSLYMFVVGPRLKRKKVEALVVLKLGAPKVESVLNERARRESKKSRR